MEEGFQGCVGLLYIHYNVVNRRVETSQSRDKLILCWDYHCTLIITELSPGMIPNIPNSCLPRLLPVTVSRTIKLYLRPEPPPPGRVIKALFQNREIKATVADFDGDNSLKRLYYGL